MRKFVAFALSCVLVISAFTMTSCDFTLHDIENQVKTDIYHIYEKLKEDVEGADKDSDFVEVVSDYCSENDLDNKGNDEFVYLEKKKTENTEEDKTVLLVETDVKESKETCQSLAIALSIYKNVYENEEFALVVAPKDKIEDIPKEYVDCDNLINIGNHQSTRIINGAAGSKIYNMNKNIKMDEPEGNLAYELKISGIESVDSGNRSDKQMNPIVQLATFLSGTRSSGYNLEISSFTNDGSIDTYPTSAKVVVVIDEGMITKFENRLTNVQEKFNEKYNEKFPNAKFQFKVVKTPDLVLDYDDTESLLSLTYTLEDGIYKTTGEDYEGEVLGICTLAKIQIEENNIQVKSYARYIDDDTEKDMDDTFKITSGLSDFDLDKEIVHRIWKEDEDNSILSSGMLKEAIEDNDLQWNVTKTFEDNSAVHILDKNKNLDIVSFETNIDDSVPAAMSLIEYLKDTTKK